MNSKNKSECAPTIFELHYLVLKKVTAPEDQAAGRQRYCGICRADHVVELAWDDNVRAYLGQEVNGKKRKATRVNMQIRDTLENATDLFPGRNAGFTVTSTNIEIEDKQRVARLCNASIINGAQTQGELIDFLATRREDQAIPSVSVEILVADDPDLIASISIARNTQNEVKSISIYGKQGRFDSLEAAMSKHDSGVKLRKSESDFDPSLLDTEKLVQVLTALAPSTVPLPSADKRRASRPETEYRVYAYRHKSRCLKDFADVMEDRRRWAIAYSLFLGIAGDGWLLYKALKREQHFSSLHCVKKLEACTADGKRLVAEDGVPDGIVFPILSALRGFVIETKKSWNLRIPTHFPWNTLLENARVVEVQTAKGNPQSMGKSADCYITLAGTVDMFFAATDGREV